jgi:hypothetical protein
MLILPTGALPSSSAGLPAIFNVRAMRGSAGDTYQHESDQPGRTEEAAKKQMPLLHLLSNPHQIGGASERPPKIPWGREQAASNFSGPAGSVTGEVLAHF